MEVTVPLGDITQYLEQIISDNVASCNLEADSVSLLAYGKGKKGKVKETCQMHDPEKKEEGQCLASFCCEQATSRLLLAGSYGFTEEVRNVERTYIDVLFISGR